MCIKFQPAAGPAPIPDMEEIMEEDMDLELIPQHPAPADPAPAAAAPADPAPAAAAPADPAPLAPLDPAPESDIEEEDQDHGDVNMDDLTYMADMSFEVPNPVHEESIQEDVIEDIPPQTNTPGPEYEVVDLGTSRGNKKLVDKRGYQYTLKKSKGEGHGYWRCAKRGKINPCPATVMQDGGNFKEGVRAHNHAAEPGVHLSVKIKSEIKETSTQNVFSQSAPQIVEDVLRRLADAEAPPASRPKPANLTRAAQRVRQSMRPKDPKDLNFELATDFLDSQMPELHHQDVYVSGQRHLLVYTTHQLQLLAKAKTWYMDATFHVVNQPWTQLFSVHSFIRSGSHMKQVPLAFCFMSRKRTDDYYEVLRAIDRLLPAQIALQTCVVDFEAGVWRAIQDRFPGTVIQGCVFHWTQALYRKIQELGLQRAYNERGDVHHFLRLVMALPFLPPEHIEGTYHYLDQRVQTDELNEFMDYVWRQWFRHPSFRVRNWSVYMLSVRTNNDLEGWHNRLNSRMNSRGPVPFYLLLLEMYKEATNIPLQARLLTEGKMQRIHRKRATEMNGQLFQAWKQYNDGLITTSQLLRACAELYGPVAN
ncbi:uncharacterized protein LOC111132122 [Crassostrea virginica]